MRKLPRHLVDHVWQVSVWPSSQTRARQVLSGVGEGELFEQYGMRSNLMHLRRRTTVEEMKRLGSNGSDRAEEMRVPVAVLDCEIMVNLPGDQRQPQLTGAHR